MSAENAVEVACRERQLPGAILIANGPGNFRSARAFGTQSLDTTEPLKTDSIFWSASCSKLQTSIAAMQCVERGLLRLDDDVSSILPEFRDVEVLDGTDPSTGQFKLVKRTEPLTLRHLLTHSSGISYDHFSPVLQKYFRQISRRVSNGRTGKIAQTYAYPLIFQPGTSWEYGAGIDWAGQMVERVTQMSLGQYLQKNVWEPLGMQDTTFRLADRPDLYGRMMEMTQRDGLVHPIYGTTLSPDAKVVTIKQQPKDVRVSDDYGGAGIYCSAADYSKLLHSIATNDEKLLKRSTVDMMFQPQLSPSSRARLEKMRAVKELSDSFAGLPPDTPADYGLGGLLAMADVPGKRKKGSMCWSGLPNVYWWIDRESSISGIFATQVLPTGDPRSVALYRSFEGSVYERVVREKKDRDRAIERL